MNGALKRREFLFGSTAAVAVGRAWGQSLDAAKMKRIATMTLNSVLKSATNPTGTDIIDYPDLVADKLGIHNLEIYPRNLASLEPAYIADFRKRLKKANSQITQVIGSTATFGNLGTLTPTAADLQARKDLIDQAAALGSPRVMIVTGSSLAPDTRQTAIEALKSMAAYAKPKKVRITMENYDIYAKDGWGRGPGRAGAPGAGPGGPGGQAGTPGGGRQGGGGVYYSAPWDELLEVCKASGTYANPDIGNFFDNTERMKGLPLMYTKTAGGSHVKYNPTQYDTGECIRISKRVGYKGLYTIEAGGGGGRGRGAAVTDPFAMPKLIRDIILANM
jgi:hypothetical protein